MNIYKRAILFLKRNILKTFVLGLSTLMTGILLFIILVSTVGVNELVNQKLEVIAPSVLVDTDYDAVYKSDNVDTVRASDVNQALSKEEISQVEDSQYWVETINTAYFELIINPLNSMQRFVPSVIPYVEEESNGYVEDNLVASVQGIEKEANLFTTQESYTFNYQFSDQELKNAENVIILNDEFMELNNLKVGDKINLGSSFENPYDFSKEDLENVGVNWLDFEIVGTYSYTPSTKEVEDAKKFITYGNQNEGLALGYNQMYIPLSTLISVQNTLAEAYFEANNITKEDIIFDDQAYHEYSRFDADVYTTFKYDDIKNKDAFIQDVEDAIKEHQYLVVEDDSSALLWEYGLLGTVAKFSNILLIITIITSSLFLGFIIILFIKDRQKEIGILIALGEKKRNIYVQVVLELAILVTMSFIVAIPIGYFTVISFVSEIPFTIFAVLVLFVIGFVITICATLTPMLYLLKLSPKKILM